MRDHTCHLQHARVSHVTADVSARCENMLRDNLQHHLQHNLQQQTNMCTDRMIETHMRTFVFQSFTYEDIGLFWHICGALYRDTVPNQLTYKPKQNYYKSTESYYLATVLFYKAKEPYCKCECTYIYVYIYTYIYLNIYTQMYSAVPQARVRTRE